MLKRARALYRVRVYIYIKSEASSAVARPSSSRDVGRSGMRFLQDEPSETRGSFAAPLAFYALVSLRGENRCIAAMQAERTGGRARGDELILFAEEFLAFFLVQSSRRSGQFAFLPVDAVGHYDLENFQQHSTENPDHLLVALFFKMPRQRDRSPWREMRKISR